jgi:hypothetical protein
VPSISKNAALTFTGKSIMPLLLALVSGKSCGPKLRTGISRLPGKPADREARKREPSTRQESERRRESPRAHQPSRAEQRHWADYEQKRDFVWRPDHGTFRVSCWR